VSDHGGNAQRDHLVRQQPECPAGAARGGRGAGHGKHVRCLHAGQLPLRAWARRLVQCAEGFLAKALSGTPDGGRADLQGRGNLFVAPAVVGVEQEASAGALTCPRCPAPQEVVHSRALFRAQRHMIFFLGHVSTRRMFRDV
jgi:hypothetical protein